MSETHPDQSDIQARDLGIEPGEALCLESIREGRRYFTITNGIVLVITDSEIYELDPEAAHYERAAAGKVRETVVGEAFEFLHGDYEPEVTEFCLGCGKEYQAGEPGCTSCPVGSETKSIDWPEVPARNPRILKDSTLYAVEPWDAV